MTSMRSIFVVFVVVMASVGSVLACGRATAPAPVAHKPPLLELRTPESFASISDRTERSAALFVEASRVMLSPRCANCHPSDDSPRQRDGNEVHDPPVARGADDRGVAALECASCHQDDNASLARIPGAPNWHLAPRAMAWLGQSPATICAQIRDPARNGGRTLAQVIDHSSHDPLVGWGWSPGADRTPAPGSQERFGALVAAWADTGAACPKEDAPR